MRVLTLSFECLLEALPSLLHHMDGCMAEQAELNKDKCLCEHVSEDSWRSFTQKLQSVLKDLTIIASKAKG